jgi:hypothetical protein
VISETRLTSWLGLVIIPAVVGFALIWQNSEHFKKGSDPEKSLSQTLIGPIDPLTDLTPLISANPGFTLTVGERSYSNLSIQQFILRNEGKAPILPADFEKPLQVHAKNGWEIVTIKNSDAPGHVDLRWSGITARTFEAEPFLLNPGEDIWQVLYLTHDESIAPKKEKNGPPIYLSVRLTNLVGFSTKPSDEWGYEDPPYPILDLTVDATVFILVFAGTLLTWYIWALSKIGFRRYQPWLFVTLVVASSSLCLATAGVLAFYLFPTPSATRLLLGTSALDFRTYWHNWVIVIVQLATAAVLLVRIRKSTRS